MRTGIKSLLLSGALGGVWGLAVVISAYMFETFLPMSSLLFFPLLFAGAAPAAVIFSGQPVPLLRAVAVGAVSGFIYQLLSPALPLLASVLAGAALGGGLSRSSGKPGDLLESVLSTLKGMVIMPALIISGSIIAGVLSGITGFPLLHWFFWGFWAVLGVSFIPRGYRNRPELQEVPVRSSTLEGFTQEVREIKRDLAELNTHLK